MLSSMALSKFLPSLNKAHAYQQSKPHVHIEQVTLTPYAPPPADKGIPHSPENGSPFTRAYARAMLERGVSVAWHWFLLRLVLR
jgi:hypothetical protein